MILQGNQRGGAKDLARHLLKTENEQVEVHELRGFVSQNLVSALNEVYAVSRGTRARQFLFSLSLNPPPSENVGVAVFEDAISRVEDKLGLTGQPRAIVFHEKEGRRHCHAVWSRIDTEAMKAIPLPHTKRKLMDLSRELYREHGWRMPSGLIRSDERDPRNFTLAQWQQAKRIGKDPRAIKQTLQDCWAASDSQAAFRQALKNHGFLLARGDRRRFVAVDRRCEVFSVPRWVGLPTKAVRARLTDPDALPSVQEAKAEMAQTIAARLNVLRDRQSGAITARLEQIDEQRNQMARRQAAERRVLREAQETRWQAELRQRQARYSRGLKGMLDRLTGRHRHIRERNERETFEAYTRDQQEKDALIFRQLEERRALQERAARLERFADQRGRSLLEDIAQVWTLGQAEPKPRPERGHARHSSRTRPGYER